MAYTTATPRSVTAPKTNLTTAAPINKTGSDPNKVYASGVGAGVGAVPAPPQGNVQKTATPLSWSQSQQQTATPVAGYAPGGFGMWGAALGAANMASNPTPGAGALAGIPYSGIPSGSTPDLTSKDVTGQLTATPVYTPSSAPSAPKPDYAAIAAQRIATQRAALDNAVNKYNTSRKSLYDYSTNNSQDQRNLDAANFNENNNPFSGKYAYDKTNMLRNNGIQDTQNQLAYQNDIASSNQKLTDFDAGATGQTQDIINQLQQQDFQNNLALNQDTRAQQTQDYNQSPTNPNNVGQTLTNQLTQLKLDGYPSEAKASAQLVQQQLQNGQITNDTAQFKLNELKDPESPTNQAAKLDLQMKQIDASNYSQESKLKLQQLQKQISQIGAAPYKSADEKEYDKQQVTKIKAEIVKIQNPVSASPKTTDYKLNPKFAEDIAYIKANPASVTMLDTEAQKFIDAYGYDGYKEMRAAAGLQN